MLQIVYIETFPNNASYFPNNVCFSRSIQNIAYHLQSLFDGVCMSLSRKKP